MADVKVRLDGAAYDLATRKFVGPTKVKNAMLARDLSGTSLPGGTLYRRLAALDTDALWEAHKLIHKQTAAPSKLLAPGAAGDSKLMEAVDAELGVDDNSVARLVPINWYHTVLTHAFQATAGPPFYGVLM